MQNEIANAKRNLIDAESMAARFPGTSEAYTAIANAWIRLAELENAQRGVQAFKEKCFE
jgi:hypothetical protein